MKTVEQRVKEIIGEQVVTIANMMAQIEQLQEKIAELERPKQE